MSEKNVEHMKRKFCLTNMISFLPMAKAKVVDGDMFYKIISVMRLLIILRQKGAVVCEGESS